MDGVDEADGVKNDVFNDVDDGSNDTDEVKATEVDKIVVTDEVINDGSGKADSVTEEEVEGCDTAELTVASSKRCKSVKKVRLINCDYDTSSGKFAVLQFYYSKKSLIGSRIIVYWYCNWLSNRSL